MIGSDWLDLPPYMLRPVPDVKYPFFLHTGILTDSYGNQSRINLVAIDQGSGAVKVIYVGLEGVSSDYVLRKFWRYLGAI